jgi:2,4-dienoyl-CoA reductase-like NADH-dependent reductase (Old Yellow Enzyme family)
MTELFENTKINSMELNNRFVRSATWEGMANPDGSCTQRLIDLMVTLAKGGAGLIISGHSYVSPEGQAGPWQLGVYSDELLPGLTRMAAAVHENQGKIVMQLAHAGCHADDSLSGLPPLGPSVLKSEPESRCRAMTIDEIHDTVAAFGRGAARAQKAGFDGVQIHAAHGYLLSEFLSPFYNRRSDDYGGSIENRSRIVLEVLQSIRAQTGYSFPVLIKMNSEDFVDSGMTMAEMIQVSKLLEKAGIDAIELSGGTRYSGRLNPTRSGKIGPDKEAFYKDAAREFKANISVPLLQVGGIRSFEVAEQLITNGLADYISLCRPLIREPELINRWQSGDTRKATCLSDNLCFNPARAGKGIYCVSKEREK